MASFFIPREIIKLSIDYNPSGIVGTENGVCRYAPKSVSTIPDRFSLWHEKLSGIVETWSKRMLQKYLIIYMDLWCSG